MEKRLTFEQLPDAVLEIKTYLDEIRTLIIEKDTISAQQNNKRFTLAEAANICKMPIPTFRTHLAKRNVSGCKVGKRWLFTEEDLSKFLEGFRILTNEEQRNNIDALLSRQNKICQKQ